MSKVTLGIGPRPGDHHIRHGKEILHLGLDILELLITRCGEQQIIHLLLAAQMHHGE